MKAPSIFPGLLLLPLLCAPAIGAGNEFGLDVLRLSPRAAVVYGDPWNNAVLAIATEKGIVVVDSSWSKSVALGFREAIQREFKRSDFAYLINSHGHFDHIGGNSAYADVPIVGHETVRQEMLAMMANPDVKARCKAFSAENEIAKMRDYYLKNDPAHLESPGYAGNVNCYRAIERDYHTDPGLTPPTITFDRRLTLHLGDVTLRLVFFGGFHSLGDTIISVPEENLVMVGQLFFPDRIPVVARTIGVLAKSTTPQMVDNWIVVLREVLAAADENTRFITCSQRKLMTKAHCQRFLAYVEQLWTGVRRARTEGQTLDQAKRALPLQSFPQVAGLPNEAFRGTEWEILDCHQHNLAFFWEVAGKQ